MGAKIWTHHRLLLFDHLTNFAKICSELTATLTIWLVDLQWHTNTWWLRSSDVYGDQLDFWHAFVVAAWGEEEEFMSHVDGEGFISFVGYNHCDVLVRWFVVASWWVADSG